MSTRSTVAPSTLGVELVDGGIIVRYLDGREAFYHGPPTAIEGAITTPPGKEVHVLVTNADGVEGVMTYVNDHDTHDEILESTGVGRVILDGTDREVLFPGVTVSTAAHSIRVEADHGVVDGRVFVFAEDDLSEHAYELVPGDGSENEDRGDDTPDDGGDDTPDDERGGFTPMEDV